MDFAKVFQLRCLWQNNAWGKKGSKSEVAKLLKCSDPTFEIDENDYYAELWMGTHRKWPSSLMETSQTLESWIRDHTSCLGHDVISKYGEQLPFLFKVLSISKTLSLQAHPGKDLAKALHDKHPDLYLDANHKPEICIALTPFRGLCGFRPIHEIVRLLKEKPEFAVVVGKENADYLIRKAQCDDSEDQKLAMKRCFAGLMKQDMTIVRHQLTKLVQSVKMKEIIKNDLTIEDKTLLKVSREYPDDIGCFSVYFLNIVQLEPGEAVFIDANVPHAYLDGDCIECMSCSDNVIRGGFTVKYKDIKTFVDMLDYNGKAAEEFLVAGRTSQEHGYTMTRYSPNIEDFAVDQIKIPRIISNAKLPAMNSASILICMDGAASISNKTSENDVFLRKGTVLFVAAYEESFLRPSCDVLLFRAYVPV